MNWTEFSQAAPELARLFRERLEKTGLALIGTIRKDGTPRISPLEAEVFEDDLLLGMMWQSKKALDSAATRAASCTLSYRTKTAPKAK